MTPENPIRCSRQRPDTPSEDGYILLGVLILLAIFIIGMAVALPNIAYMVQRDRELETMHRGKQYIRAVQLYYHKFQAYPPNIEALVKTNEIRFLRKRYIDPITGKDDWKPIQYCQNKAPIAMGFFGQPLGPAMGCGTLAGIGPGGGNGLQGSSVLGGQPGNGTSGGLTPANGPMSPTGSLFNNSGTPGTTGTIGSTGSSDGSTGQTGTSPTGTTPGSSTGTTDANGNPTSADNGQTLGGGGIIGFSPPVDKKSILVYKKKKKYNEWEFTYGPQMEMQGGMMGGNTGTIGQPAGGIGSTPPTTPGGSTIGPTTGPGNNGGAPISPIQTPPQQ